MGENSKGPANKAQDITSKPDELVKGGAKSKTELTDEELKSVSGGTISTHYQPQKPDGTND